MRLYYDNLADGATVTLTATTEASTLPVENLVNDHVGRVYRTGTTQALEAVVIDLQTAQAVTSFIAFNTNLTASDTLVKIQANSSDSWDTPAFSADLTVNTTYSYANAVFSSQSYRYWRFTFTKSSASETRDIGRIFLGTYVDTTEGPDFDGVTVSLVDMSSTQYSRGGQSYSQSKDSYREWDIQKTNMSYADTVKLVTLSETVGTHIPFFFVIDPNASEFSEILYVKMTAPFKRKAGAYSDSGYFWTLSLPTLREEL